MKNDGNKIPLYDICTLESDRQQGDVIAVSFPEYLQAHPKLHFPHRHSFYHIVLFTGGSGHHTIDFERFSVHPGQIYFMRPGQVHDWQLSADIDGYVINFPENLFEGFLASDHYFDRFPFLGGIAASSVRTLQGTVFRDTLSIVERLVETATEKGRQAGDLMRTYLIQLFITVNKCTEPRPQEVARPQSQLILFNFRKLIDIHYAEKRLPRQYAAMLYITPNHLNALTKELTGRSAGELIRDRILLEAKRLLVNADMSIATIAAELNFTDNAHLTRFFRKHTQMSPEEFRKQSCNHH